MPRGNFCIPLCKPDAIDAAEEKWRQATARRLASVNARTAEWVDWHQTWHRQIMEHSQRPLDWLEDHPDREPEVIEMMRQANREWAGGNASGGADPKLVEYAAICGKAVMLRERFALIALSLLICPVASAHSDDDALAGIAVTPQHHRYDYRRAAFGEAWDNGGPCDTATRSSTVTSPR